MIDSLRRKIRLIQVGSFSHILLGMKLRVMAVIKRNQKRIDRVVLDKENQAQPLHGNSRTFRMGYLNIMYTCLVALALFTGLLVFQGTYSVQGDIGRGPTILGNGYKISVQFNIPKADSMSKMDGHKLVSLGPHLVIVDTKCPKKSASSIFLQVSGDAFFIFPW